MFRCHIISLKFREVIKCLGISIAYLKKKIAIFVKILGEKEFSKMSQGISIGNQVFLKKNWMPE